MTENAASRPDRRPAEINPDETKTRLPSAPAELLVLLIRALEAHEDGDHRLVVDLLRVALAERHVQKGCRCGDCGRWFEWPGVRDVHFCAGRKR